MIIKIYNFVQLLIFISTLILGVYGVPPVIVTNNGPVEGVEIISKLGEKYYSFKGVPYAEAPITGIDPNTGKQVDRRFKAPKPLERKWTQNLKANAFGNLCFVSSNFNLGAIDRSEDCLFLNIYVPVDGMKKKSVLVWIHGGAFTEGDATDNMFGPDFLLSGDNIVVTVAYRVGIFGFLNLGTSDYSGNMGLKDQQMALKWIYENIEHFSGNKDQILLFGESAGGASVTYQMLNEQSRKYFKRAFFMSGSALNYWALTTENHLDRIEECSRSKEFNEIIEYIKSTNSDELVRCYYDYVSNKALLKPKWTPTIENLDAKDAIITESPYNIYHSENAPVLDTWISFNSQEFVTFDRTIVENTELLIKENWKKSKIKLPFDNFNQYTHPKEYKEILDKLRIAYYNDVTNFDTTINANIHLLTDINFADSILKTFVYQIEANNKGVNHSLHKNTFLYRFNINDGLNFVQLTANTKYDGAAHADELCYWFYCHIFDEFNIYDKYLTNKTSTVYLTINRLVRMISNFARTGNPSIIGDTPFKHSTSASEVFCNEFNNNPNANTTVDIKEQLHFDTWREVEEIHNKSSASFVYAHMGSVLTLSVTTVFIWLLNYN